MVKAGSWNWDRVSESSWGDPAEDIYYLLHRWGGQRRRRILDLGCGIGRHSLLFAAHGFRVAALDSSESGLRRLQAAATDKRTSVCPVRGDLTGLPFGEGLFDFLLAYHSIYHVDSEGMAAAVAEAHRVLSPGAEIYLTLGSKADASYGDPSNGIVDDHVRMKREEDGGTLPHYYCDLGDVLRLLSRFTITRIRHIEEIYEGKSSWHYFVLAHRN